MISAIPVSVDTLSRDSIINMPPRLRMSTLYAIAQALPNGGRVANTCNRSEDFIGYSTKFGDAAGDFSPLSNLLVHEVIQIGEVLGVPERLTRKTPSDGLSGMSDEDKKIVDDWMEENGYSHIADVVENTRNEFNKYPAFGLACETETVVMAKQPKKEKTDE